MPITQRLHTLIPLERATVPVTFSALPRAVPASLRQACLNPVCDQTCEWPRKGRPRLFCSRECREAYVYERAELLKDVAVLEASLQAAGGTYRQYRTLQAELAQRRWSLIRYGARLEETTS